MPSGKKRKPKYDQYPKSLKILRSYLGEGVLIKADHVVDRKNLIVAADALQKRLETKKAREKFKLAKKVRLNNLTRKEAARAKVYKISPTPHRHHIEYRPDFKRENYYAVVNGEINTDIVYTPKEVRSLLVREKEARAINNLQRILGTTEKQARKITTEVKKNVAKDFARFKKSKKYLSLDKEARKKYSLKRWKRRTLMGLNIALGDYDESA